MRQPSVQILQGDALEQLKMLDSNSVHCCITSPPYFSQRDYGVDGQLGLEKTPQEYVSKLVDVFREVKRVLRDDGVLWLNLGDSYFSTSKGSGGKSKSKKQSSNAGSLFDAQKIDGCGLKTKDLVGIPWRVAFALQDDGWYLRSCVPWVKRGCMPESVKDRVTVAHEYIFMLSKKSRYFYDADAVRIPSKPESIQRMKTGWGGNSDRGYVDGVQNHMNKYCGTEHAVQQAILGRNMRTSDFFFGSIEAILNGESELVSDGNGDPVAFVVNKSGYSGAHYAVFPPKLIVPMIKAGTSEKGCCSVCGAPYTRIVECKVSQCRQNVGYNQDCLSRNDGNRPGSYTVEPGFVTGWQKQCNCDSGIIPCTVLDPFAGSGTTLAEAARLGRSSIGIELNPDYIKLINKRVDDVLIQPRLL